MQNYMTEGLGIPDIPVSIKNYNLPLSSCGSG